MRNISMLTWANLRKSKSQAISLLLFMLIAAMFLNIGLVIFLRLGGFFDKRAESNHTAHFAALYSDASGADSVRQGLDFMQNYPGVTETETIYAIGGWSIYYLNGIESAAFNILSRADAAQRMDAPRFVGEALPLIGDRIYIPYFMIAAGDYKIGDEFKLEVSDITLRFMIAGATEEIMFGAQMNSLNRFYISDERFYELQAQLPDSGITLISARLEQVSDTVFLTADYNRAVSTDGLYLFIDYEGAKMMRTMVPLIVAVIITAFSIILLCVSLIVIRFRIINSIEEGMTNIGAQKAVGFRSAQIISSILMQFGSLAVIGSAAGIALSLLFIPIITGVLEPIYALVWNPGFDVFTAVISLLSVFLTVMVISFISSRSVNKLHPLIALRGGITTHSFRKNILPLEKAFGPLSALLALKQLLQNKKQAVTISVIIAAVTAAAVAGIGIDYNMNTGRDNFARAFFGELANANFSIRDAGFGEAFKERMSERPEVDKIFGYEFPGELLLIDEINATIMVSEDCSLLEGNMLVEGRYPRHDNEIALGSTVLKVTGKNVGDIVAVRSGEKQDSYIITGIIQHMRGGGFNGIITGEGLREIMPDFQFLDYDVYLYNGVDTAAFIEDVKAAEGDVLYNVLNIEEQIASELGVMGGIFRIVAIGIAAVTAGVVILTLYMVLKTAILRRRRELGIQKAVGFTTLQLMNQISTSMTPCILIGVIFGAAAGYLGFNPMVTALTSSMGIVQVNLPIPLGATIAVCTLLIALSYGISMLVALQIRKVSAYALVTE